MWRSRVPPGETELGFRFEPPFLPNRRPLLRAKLGNPNADSAWSGLWRREREPHDEPAARRVGRADGRAVRVGDLAHDGESEARAVPRAPVRAAEEAVEELRELVLGRPRAVVANLEHAVAQPDVDRAARRAVSGGVVEDVVDGAAEAVGHADDDARREV